MHAIINPWTYEYIRRLADEATILAKQELLRPVLAQEVVKNFRASNRLNIPFLGDYVPAGWERIDYLIEPVFVDTTGTPAPLFPTVITQFEFFRRAEQHLKGEASFVIGYGVIEMGQVQALVAAYRRME